MNKFKTYAFWVALSSAIVILVQSLGRLFGFEIESAIIENVIMSICGVLVVLGIVTKNNTSADNVETVEKTDLTEDDNVEIIEEKEIVEDIIIEQPKDDEVVKTTNEEINN